MLFLTFCTFQNSDLSGNSLKTLGEKAFHKLVALNTLDLSYNRFENVPVSGLRPLKNKLVDLILKGNAIKSISDNAFQTLPALTSM